VRRRRSHTDRRTVLVELTDEGHARAWEAYGPLLHAGQPLLDELSSEQLELLADYLQRFTALTDEDRQLILSRSPHPA
jgi:DNA-binding MarR family transcriptional regulator